MVFGVSRSGEYIKDNHPVVKFESQSVIDLVIQEDQSGVYIQCTKIQLIKGKQNGFL